MTTPGNEPPMPPQPPGQPPAQHDGPPPQQPPASQGPSMGGTPNAEKYVLAADAMRRRQLRSALLHGSRRTWREHKRIWPAIVVGVIATAVVVAAMAVVGAYQKQMDKKEKEEEERESSTPALVVSYESCPTRYVECRATGPLRPHHVPGNLFGQIGRTA